MNDQNPAPTKDAELSFTLQERLVLSAIFEIRGSLAPQGSKQAEDMFFCAKVLEQGYTTMYPQVTFELLPELSDTAITEFLGILEMFRSLKHAQARLTTDEVSEVQKGARNPLSFAGLDLNSTEEYRLLTLFKDLISWGRYPDLKLDLEAVADHGNSHTARMPQYRLMANLYRNLIKAKQNDSQLTQAQKYELTFDDLLKIARV